MTDVGSVSGSDSHRTVPSTLLILLLAGPTLSALLYFAVLSGESWPRAVYVASKVILNLAPLAWLVFFMGWRPGLPEWDRRGALRGIGFGLLAGAAVIGAYFLLFRGRLDLCEVRSRVEQLGLSDHFVLYSVFIIVGNSLLEEYYWRWFLFRMLRRPLGFRAAASLSAVSFAAYHAVALVHYVEVPLAALATFGIIIAGLFWAWLYERHPSLIPIWLSHLVVDAFLFGLVWLILFGGLG